jgi:hypothetical protein
VIALVAWLGTISPFLDASISSELPTFHKRIGPWMQKITLFCTCFVAVPE